MYFFARIMTWSYMHIKAKKRKKDEHGRETMKEGRLRKKWYTGVSLNDIAKEIEKKIDRTILKIF